VRGHDRRHADAPEATLLTRPLLAAVGLGGFAAAFAVARPDAGDVRAPIHWLVRPAVLPFVWRDLETATQSGDAAEVFALSRRIVQILPSWTDGHIVFAYRFALQSQTLPTTPGARAEAALQRLQVALAWLESVRPDAGNREVELLEAMATLPEVAQNREPGLDALLTNPGGAAGLAERYLAEAEAISAGPYVRERRTLQYVRLAAAMLGQGDVDRALAVLETGIARSADLRDRELATEWAQLLGIVVRHLRGEEVDLAPVRADRRMDPLVPYLR